MRTTWTCTPSDGPTHSGSEAPRAAARARGSSSGSAFASRSRQPVHSPVSTLWVRTWAVACSRAPAPCQETPSIENCFVPVRGSSRPPFAPLLSARSYTRTGRSACPPESPEDGLATAYDTTPAPPRTTTPSVSHARRRRLSGL
ncbi:hypothetical protein ACQF4J_19025 [Streptomyces sp. C1-1]|uniref:hypothetical protein n=1 Tax=Streptomyces sp. C1-1 TaxID=3231173 RepID=UPI003D081FF1